MTNFGKLLLIVSLTVLCILVVAAGSIRYDGPEGLLRRVRMEVAAHRPHPDLVPTPLAPGPSAAAAGTRENVPVFHRDVTRDAVATPEAVTTQTPGHRPAAPSVALTGLQHTWQGWNNCGPATLAMHLSYYGSTLDQEAVASALKPDPDDKNVGPAELADFARSHGLHALVRVNGDRDRVRTLLTNGIPVLIETWLEPEPNDGMGHYRLLTGYDDTREEWIAYDSLVSDNPVNPEGTYAGIRLPYGETERLWKVFNHTYVLVYTDEQAPVVESILADDVDDDAMWQRALAQARAEVEQHPDDPFAWFNLGTDLTAVGAFEQAADAYDHARQIGLPWRMLWYQFGPFRAYYEVGRYDEVVALADATLRTAGNVEELYYWKGRGLAAAGDPAHARQAFQRAVALNPNYVDAADALAHLDAQ